MVDNSTNVSKANNHLSQQIKSLSIQQTKTYDLKNAGPGLGQAQKCGRIKPANGIPILGLFAMH
jgi:hypothetical protein